MQMQDDKLLRKLNKEPEIGMKMLMDQYAALVYAVVKDDLHPKISKTFGIIKTITADIGLLTFKILKI